MVDHEPVQPRSELAFAPERREFGQELDENLLRGILGISDEVRNGFQNIAIRFEVEGDAPAEKLAQIVDQARARSAVFDVLANGVPVTVGMKSVQ